MLNDSISRNVYCLALKDSNIFAGTSSGILHSSDNGVSWKKIKTGPIYSLRQIIINDKYIIFAGMEGGGIYRSSDNGANWTEINSGLTNDGILSLAINEKNIYAGTKGSGVFVSTNDGDNWSPVNNGILGNTVNCSVTKDSNIFVGTSFGGVFHSTDNGNSWSERNTDLSSSYDRSIYSIALKDTVLFVGEHFGVYMTTNYGLNWKSLVPDFKIPANNIIIKDTNVIISTRDYGIFLTTDMGVNWLQKNSGLLEPDVRAILLDENDIYAGTYGYGVARSTNTCESWEHLLNGLDIRFILCLAKCGDMLLAGSKGGTLYYSTNNGENWYILASDFNDVDINNLLVIGSNIFAGTLKGLYISKNFGVTWEKAKPPLDTKTIFSLSRNDKYIFASTMHKSGFYRAKLSDLGIVDVSEKLTQIDFQIFPNPATNEITLSLPEEQNINSISIFNSLGIEKKRIEQTEIIGNSKITISTADLPVGLYHCSFVNQTGRVTKSFVVVR